MLPVARSGAFHPKRRQSPQKRSPVLRRTSPLARMTFRICGGACGGDLPFAEAALARSALLEIYIPFEEPISSEGVGRFRQQRLARPGLRRQSTVSRHVRERTRPCMRTRIPMSVTIGGLLEASLCSAPAKLMSSARGTARVVMGKPAARVIFSSNRPEKGTTRTIKNHVSAKVIQRKCKLLLICAHLPSPSRKPLGGVDRHCWG